MEIVFYQEVSLMWRNKTREYMVAIMEINSLAKGCYNTSLMQVGCKIIFFRWIIFEKGFYVLIDYYWNLPYNFITSEAEMALWDFAEPLWEQHSPWLYRKDRSNKFLSMIWVLSWKKGFKVWKSLYPTVSSRLTKALDYI